MSFFFGIGGAQNVNAPAITELQPTGTNAAMDVSTIQITFDQNVEWQSGSVTLYQDLGGGFTLYQTWAVPNTGTPPTNFFTFGVTPSGALDAGDYAVQMTASAWTNAAMVGNAAVSDNVTYPFTIT